MRPDPRAKLVRRTQKLNWLAREREMGYAEWREDPMVFLKRARLWDGG